MGISPLVELSIYWDNLAVRLLLISPYPYRGVWYVTVFGWLLVVATYHPFRTSLLEFLEYFLKGLEVGSSIHILVILVEVTLLAL